MATDADLAGRVAAERDYWLLTQHGLDPAAASFPEGFDPAEVLARRGPAVLVDALTSARPLGDLVLQSAWPTSPATPPSLRPRRSQPPGRPRRGDPPRPPSPRGFGSPPATPGGRLLSAVEVWNRDPRKAAAARLAAVQQVRDRVVAADRQDPNDRWAEVARRIDPQLPFEGDWPALAAIMALAHRDGHDVAAIARQLVAADPLGHQPVQDLRYRLVAALPVDVGPAPSPAEVIPRSGAERDRLAGRPKRDQPTGRHR